MWLPFESNILELSNVLRCHGTWLSFLVQPATDALLGWVGRMRAWHTAVTELVAVTELQLEFMQ